MIPPRAQDIPDDPEFWSLGQSFFMGVFPLSVASWISYTLLVLDRRVDHPPYQLVFPAGQLIVVIGLVKHNKNLVRQGIFQICFAYVLEYLTRLALNRSFTSPFNPYFLAEQMNRSVLDTFSKCDKSLLFLLVIRPFVYAYMHWFMEEVSVLQSMNSEDVVENECRLMGYLKRHYPEVYIFFRAIFPGHPIIYSVRYYYVILSTAFLLLISTSFCMVFSV